MKNNRFATTLLLTAVALSMIVPTAVSANEQINQGNITEQSQEKENTETFDNVESIDQKEVIQKVDTSENQEKLEEEKISPKEHGQSLVASQNEVDTLNAVKGKTVWLDTAAGSDAADGSSTPNSVKTLEKALELAGEGGTIMVTGDREIEITSSITLDNNITILRDENLKSTANVIYVKDGGNLIINHATIDGNNIESAIGTLVEVRNASCSINEGAILRNNKTRVVSVIAQGADSNVVMNGGEICDNNTDWTVVEIGTWFGGQGIATFTMNGGSIHDNSTDYQTVVMTDAIANNEKVFNMNGGTIINNTNKEIGAVEIDNGIFNMSGGSIEDNVGTKKAGGVSIKGDLTIAKITGGNIKKNKGVNGGGIYLTGGTLNLEGGSITGNTAKTGGGIDASGNNSSTINITGGDVSNNSASSYGGGVYVHSATTVANISGGTISKNTSPWAGGIFIWNNATANISGNTLITENKTTGERNGGGINLYGGTLNITGGTISKNEARDGAGIDVSNGTAILEKDALITENMARRNGGGISISGGTLTINGSTISENTAVGNGGAILTTNGRVVVNAAIINSNIANVRGGGMFIWNKGTVEIEKGTVITKNKANQGGGIELRNHPLTIDGAEITDNEAMKCGSGISVWDNGEVTVKGNTSISGNKITAKDTKEYASTVFVWGNSDSDTKFVMESGSIKNNTATGECAAGIAAIGEKSNAVVEVSGGEISGNANESGKKQGIRLFKTGEKNGVVRLSGSPVIKDEIFLNDHEDQNAKIEVTGEFKPQNAVKVNDTSWTDYRTIVTYAAGLTAKAEDFTPASGLEKHYIIKDGQDLKSMNKLTVIFREKDTDKKYGEAYVVAKDKLSKSQIPEIVKKGYELIGWKNEADDKEWNFVQDMVAGDLVLNPIWKLKLPKGTVSAVDGKTDIHEGDPVTLEANVTHEAEENIRYQLTWFKDGKKIENEKKGRGVSDTHYLTVTEAGTYSAKVTATDGIQTTEEVELGVVEVTASSHVFGKWTVKKQPTETEKGLKERTCTICGLKETDEIPATEKIENLPTIIDKKNELVKKEETTMVAGGNDKPKSVRTGDENSLEIAAGTMLFMLGVGAIMIVRRKKEREEE